MSADELLAQAEASYDEGEALGLLTLAIAEINDEIAAGKQDRVRKHVERLLSTARKVAETTRARGFSITIGLPAGVSVSFDWARDDRRSHLSA